LVLSISIIILQYVIEKTIDLLLLANLLLSVT